MQAKLLSNKVSKTYKWMVTFSSGSFMFIALYFYRAYHIDQVPAFTGHSMFFRALTHSVIISLVFYLLEFHVSAFLKVKERFRPLITALIATFMGLNLTFLAFNYFYHWTELYWSSYLQFLYEYPLIIAFPVILSLLIDRLSGHTEPGSDSLISITSENQKEHFQIKSKNLLFIKSADNYIEICHRSMQEIHKHLLRKTLKEVEREHQPGTLLVRCHRSYLVNPANIDQVNISNGKIGLTIFGTTIPVSKKYLQNLSEKLPQLFAPHLKNSSQID